MYKPYLLYYFIIFFTFLVSNISFSNSAYQIKEIGSPKDKKGFNEIDLNSDGKISYYEFQQIRQRRFDRLDLNKDNVVTQDEFEKRNQKFFLEVDQNQDKFLTKIELFKKRKKMRNILE